MSVSADVDMLSDQTGLRIKNIDALKDGHIDSSSESDSSDDSDSTESSEGEFCIIKQPRQTLRDNILLFQDSLDQLLHCKTHEKQKNFLSVQNTKLLRTTVQLCKAVYQGKAAIIKNKHKSIFKTHKEKLVEIFDTLQTARLKRREMLGILYTISAVDNGKLLKMFTHYRQKIK